MKKIAIGSVVLVIVLLGLYAYYVAPGQLHYNPVAQGDLERWCDISKRYDWEKSKTAEMQVNQESEYLEAVKNSFRTSSAKNIFEIAAFHSEKNERWSVVQTGAKEIGIEKFECPALKSALESLSFGS